MWLHTSQNLAFPDSRPEPEKSIGHKAPIFSHTESQPLPARKSPASASRHPLFSTTPGGRPRDVKRRKVEVRAQGCEPRGFPAPAEVPTAQPPERGRPDPGSADAPPPPPPPISGVQGRGRLARRRLGRGRGRAGDRPPRSSGRCAQTPGPAPEGASAAPGSARSGRARGLPLAAWSATLGVHPPPRWGPSPREDGVLDDLQSRGVSAAHGAPSPAQVPGKAQGGAGTRRGGRPRPGQGWAGPASGLPGGWGPSASSPWSTSLRGSLRQTKARRRRRGRAACGAAALLPRRWAGGRARQEARAPRSRSPRCAAPPCGPGSGAPRGGALRRLRRR